MTWVWICHLNLDKQTQEISSKGDQLSWNYYLTDPWNQHSSFYALPLPNYRNKNLAGEKISRIYFFNISSKVKYFGTSLMCWDLPFTVLITIQFILKLCTCVYWDPKFWSLFFLVVCSSWTSTKEKKEDVPLEGPGSRSSNGCGIIKEGSLKIQHIYFLWSLRHVQHSDKPSPGLRNLLTDASCFLS